MNGPIPQVVWQRMITFLAAGHTGRIVLNVKSGEIRSYELTETGDAGQRSRIVPAPALDENGHGVKQSPQ